ncbi:ROK family protein [bacterium]|nr:MAG: ROK family protein [bacterium]
MSFGLGLDAGGTFLKATAATGGGKVLAEASVPTRPERGARAFIAEAAALVKRLESGLGGRAPGLCVAIAGDVDPRAGRIRRSPNLLSFEGFPLRASLSRALGRRVALHNDANMAAWGAYAVELRRRVPDVLALTLGTGVGGGAVLGGRLVVGSTGTAAEFGHMRVVAGGYPCRCGARGCLEAHAGSYGLERTVRDLLAERPRARSRLRGAAFTPKDVSEAAERGDALAREAWRRVGKALGIGVVNLVYAFNPRAVVFCGGLSRAGRLYLGEVENAAGAESFRGPFGSLRLSVARRLDLGAVGAAVYALERDG